MDTPETQPPPSNIDRVRDFLNSLSLDTTHFTVTTFETVAGGGDDDHARYYVDEVRVELDEAVDDTTIGRVIVLCLYERVKP